jgi:hypothetical protein
LASAEFATLRLHLLRVASRVIETASRVRIAFAAACPHAALFRGLARSFHPAGPWSMGPMPRRARCPTTPNAASPSATSPPQAGANTCPTLKSAHGDPGHPRPTTRKGLGIDSAGSE